MTKYEQEYCNKCDLHENCAFVLRGLERKCTDLDIFAGGFEQAIEQVSEWLDKEALGYIRTDFDSKFLGFDYKELIDDMKKDLEGNN